MPFNASTPVSQIAIIEAKAGLEYPRRRAGQRHTLPLCLPLFTLAMLRRSRQRRTLQEIKDF
ncbi:hypothetical protein [Moorena sp. SIOASIH]|uniref:hypothetical protein n=1 Tax=Moorena sp. SIOASIH TaxID=2607817 RepID=UPI0025E8DA29|nr:hypothetical protein [Moorena sp. SIOASIH]